MLTLSAAGCRQSLSSVDETDSEGETADTTPGETGETGEDEAGDTAGDSGGDGAGTGVDMGDEGAGEDEAGEEEECVPMCDGMECGDDGCGGSCGSCGFNTACSDDFECVDLVEGCEDTAGYEPGSPWPTSGYCETRIFQSPLSGPADQPQTLWIYNIGEPLGDVVVSADGTIIGGTENGFVHAINPDGTEKWAIGLGGGSLLEAPAIAADGSIYVHLQDQAFNKGSLFKLSPDGDELWEADLATSKGHSSPLITGEGEIFTADGGGIVGYDADGGIAFESNFFDQLYQGGLARGPQGRFYIAGHNNLWGIEADGINSWSYPLPQDEPYEQSYPTVGPQGVYFAGRAEDYVFLLDKFDGELLASSDQAPADDSMGISPTGAFVFGTLNTYATSVVTNGSDLLPSWSQSAQQVQGENQDLFFGRLTIDDKGRVFRGWFNGKVVGINASGALMWEIDVGHWVDRAVVIGEDETLYVPGGDGLTALQ